MVRDFQLYIISILPCLAPKVLVPGKHHKLKDLPFYEEARAVDTKERQDRLDQREKKRQEGTLRQAPGIGLATSSTAHPLTKKPIFRPIEKALNLSPYLSFSSLST